MVLLTVRPASEALRRKASAEWSPFNCIGLIDKRTDVHYCIGMSTGKRLAKRSILGTRVCAPLEDGLYVPGVIQATKTDANDQESIYCVLFDDKTSHEYKSTELIGPGFQSVTSAILKIGQKVFLTYNGREVSGSVVYRKPDGEDFLITIHPTNNQYQQSVEVTKKLDEIRLMESRKSARLQDLDTDYSRLADGQTEPRRRAFSLSIEVPTTTTTTSGRKRRSSAEDNVMDDCMAAMVLMSLSCSPKSSRLSDAGNYSLSWTSGSSWSSTYSPTQSPPSPSSQGEVDVGGCGHGDGKLGRFSPTQDEGIDVDETIGFLEAVKEKIGQKIVFQCTWPGCTKQYDICEDIEKHVCITHLGRDNVGDTDHEEEFYYTEIEIGDSNFHVPPLSPTMIHGPNIYSSSVPTLSHLDMARPPHEDPEYQRHIQEQTVFMEAASGPVNIPSSSYPVSWQIHGYATSAPSTMGSSPQKFLRLSSKSTSSPLKVSTFHRKGRSESRKCRKVYGMDNREAWCTQCKWKKACSRFVD